jgi:ABC-2 type transport system permease protein
MAFFVGNFEGPAKAARWALAATINYPYTLFKPPFKYLLVTLIPSFFVTTLPVSLVTEFSWITVAKLGAAAVGSTCIALFVFNHGLKRYESGSLINVRL